MFAFSDSLRPYVLAALLGLLACGRANAEGFNFSSPFAKLALPKDRVETSNGFDMTGKSWSAYSAAVISPAGPLHHDGLRLKLLGSFGAYAYDTKRVYCALSAEEKKKATGTNFSRLCNDLANRPLTPEERDEVVETIAPFGLQLEGDQIFHVQPHQIMHYDLAIMPGYQVSWRAVTLKAYLGPAMETRSITPADSEKLLAGTYWGAKTGLETWIGLGSAFWLAADTSYFTGTEAYSASLRFGYKPLSWLTLGPEIAAFGDAEDESARAGGFLRFQLGKVETTVSGGVSADYQGGTSPYGSAGFYLKF